MTPHAISELHFSVLDLIAFKKVSAFVDELPDHEELTCHVVARLAQPFAPHFHVADGHFLQGAYAHSWLQRNTTIIDPYPWAAASPLMITLRHFSPWNHLYDTRHKERLGDELAAAENFIRKFRTGIVTS